MKKIILVAAAAATLLAGCGGNAIQKDAAQLTDRQWVTNAAVTTPEGKTTVAPSPMDPRLRNLVTVLDTWHTEDGKYCAQIHAVKVEKDNETYNRDGIVCAKPGEAFAYQQAPVPVEKAKKSSAAPKKDSKKGSKKDPKK